MEENFNRKNHWEKVYKTSDVSSKSWYQPVPQYSLSFFDEHRIPLSAQIIDVGGGNSFLVDHLLERGYKNISVLDISEAAIEKARNRLGDKANKVRWLVDDISGFLPGSMFDVWHDRATLHFLTDPKDIDHYYYVAEHHIRPGGLMLIGAFSENGPKKCSGLDVQQYSADTMTHLFSPDFERLKCEYVDHETPSGAVQNFVFCQFRRKDYKM